MSGTFLLFGAIAAYLVSSWLVLIDIRAGIQGTERRTASGLYIATLGALLQLGFIALNSAAGQGLDFSLHFMLLVVSSVVVVCFLLGCLGMEIYKLGILVFPWTALCLVFALLWEPATANQTTRPLLPLSAFSGHVIVSLLAYSLLTIAAIQSVLYLYQERQFRRRTAPNMLAGLPPLQTMESLLFRLVWMGFILLTAALLSGAIFSHEIFGKAFEFNHHTVLAFIGWCVFAALLYQRINTGIRGLPATALTLVGFFLIQLGYFGTKIVNESLNL